MKNSFLICFVLFLNSCILQSNARRPQAAKLFIERPENNGSINIVPCVIQLDVGPKIILLGGETNFLCVKPGKHFLTAKSANPFPDTSKDFDWQPTSLQITITDAQTARIILEPKSRDSAYKGGWDLLLKNRQ